MTGTTLIAESTRQDAFAWCCCRRSRGTRSEVLVRRSTALGTERFRTHVRRPVRVEPLTVRSLGHFHDRSGLVDVLHKVRPEQVDSLGHDERY